MNDARTEYVKQKVASARETLDDAEALLTRGSLRSTVNRIYYACFYAVNALLYHEGMSSSKHGGVIALFDQHWMKPHRLPVEMGKFYREIFEFRQEGDYKDARFETRQVTHWLEQARAFVEKIAEWLRSNAGIDI